MDFAAAAATPTTTAASGQATPGHSFFWSGDDFSFGDVLDVINPLQHIPIVGTIYRQVTGERIGHLPQLLGDTLYGGVSGAISAVANIATEEITGKDIGQQVLSMLGMDGSAGTQLASAAGGVPTHPKLVGITRTAMDPDDRRGDSSGGFDYGTSTPAPVLTPMLASAASGTAATPGSAGNAASATGATAPAGASLASAMLSADAAVAAGLAGLGDDLIRTALTTASAGSGAIGAGMTRTASAAPTGLAGASQAVSSQTGAGLASPLKPLSSSQGGTVRSVSGQMLSNHAVPLSVPGTLLGGMRRSPAPTASAPVTADTTATLPSAGGTALPNPQVPVDVSQRMIDALQRYSQMEAARKAAQTGAPTSTSTLDGLH